MFHHIEFMRLSERRVLVILVAPDGDVQNRVIFTAHDYTSAQLLEASNFLNAHYAGLTIEEVRERLKTEVDALRGEISALMQAAVQAGSEAIAESHEQVVIAGERNLLAIQDFSSDMGSLRKLFDLFEQKTQLMRLLEVSSRAEGVRIFIGGESLRRAVRGAVGRLGAVRGRRPGGRHARRDRPDAHGLQPHDPDRRHHVAPGQQRAQHEVGRCRRCRGHAKIQERAVSSVGQSRGLIILWSLVRSQHGLPGKSTTYARLSFLAVPKCQPSVNGADA